MSVLGITKIMEGIRERVTGAAANINTDHKYIHEGIAYKAHFTVGALAHSTTIRYSMKTPEARYLHFKDFALYGVGASLRFRIYRGTDTNPLVIDDPDTGNIGAGDLLGPVNVNDLGRPSETVFGLAPTFTAAAEGEIWDQVISPGSSTNQYRSSDKASASDNFEYVMRPDTDYVLEITNLEGSGSAAHVGLSMFWYEEDDA